METSIIDLSPVLSILLQCLGGVVLAVGSWALYKVQQKFGLENEDKLREVVMGAIERGVTYGKHKAEEELKDSDWAKIETKNAMIGHAASYVLGKVPDAVKKFGLSEEQIKDLVLAKLDVPESTTKKVAAKK